jgi:hypothetical protein
MVLQIFVEPWLLLSFVIFFTQSLRLLRRGISPSQGRYLHTGQHETESTHTDINALSRIRTHDLSVRANQDGSCVASVTGSISYYSCIFSTSVYKIDIDIARNLQAVFLS